MKARPRLRTSGIIFPFAILAFGSFPSLVTAGGNSPRETPHLTIEKAVLAELGRRADKLGVLRENRETILCLTGRRDGNRFAIDGIFAPTLQISIAAGARVVFDECPRDTVGWWHNHPRGNCALSPKDAETAIRKRFPITVVHASSGSWCWWSRDQVRSIVEYRRRMGESPGPIYGLPGQETLGEIGGRN